MPATANGPSRAIDGAEVVDAARRALLATCGAIRVTRISLRKARQRFDKDEWPTDLDWPRSRPQLMKQLDGLPPHAVRRRLASGWCGILDALSTSLPKLWNAVEESRDALADIAAWIAQAGCSSQDLWTITLRRRLGELEHEPLILTQPPAGSMRHLSTMLQHLRGDRDSAKGYPSVWDEIEADLIAAARMMKEIRTPAEWCRQSPPGPDSRDRREQWRPARWFAERTDRALYPDILRRALSDGRVKGRKATSGRLNQYEVHSVCAAYPQYEPLLLDRGPE